MGRDSSFKKSEIANSTMYYEYLSIIIRNARKLKELTDNILDIARMSQSINLNKQVGNRDTLILDAVQDGGGSDVARDVKLLYHNITESSRRGITTLKRYVVHLCTAQCPLANEKM
jgi:signal transduction histidine kinase